MLVLTFVANSTSWKKRVKKGVFHEHYRRRHDRDDRDSDQRRNGRRGNRKIMWLMAFPGVFGASTVQDKRRRRRRGLGAGDEDSSSEDDEDEDDDSGGDDHPG